MTRLSRCVICLVTVIGAFAVHVDAVQRGWLREAVRTGGDIKRHMTSCGPPTGLKEVVALTQLTVEGTIARADAALREDDHEEFVYTDFLIDVTRVFRWTVASGSLARPGATALAPFLQTPAASRPVPTALRVRLRAFYHGTVTVEGGSISDSSGFPTLRIGQHIIVSGHFNADVGEWTPFGVFEVRDGRVVALDTGLDTRDYDSVEEFAIALSNPPPTVVRVR
jgi:hypothetical protein